MGVGDDGESGSGEAAREECGEVEGLGVGVG